MRAPDKNDVPLQGLSLERRATVMIALAGLIALGGCGRGGRISLEGTVTLDGSPLEDGYVTFIPEANTRGSDAGGRIQEGRFSIGVTGGTFSGTFRVEITANRETDRKQVDDITGKLVPVIQQVIPARYNEQSELTAEVREDGTNEFEFALSSM